MGSGGEGFRGGGVQGVRGSGGEGFGRRGVREVRAYLWGLGSFFASRSCRIILHFPMGPLGLDMDMPLMLSLEDTQQRHRC